MLSKKDLNSAELEIVRVSKSPTTVVAANGEVQTKEEATVYVKELEFFRDSKASRRHTCRSLTRKTLRRSRIFLRVDQCVSETTTHQRWQTNTVQHGELRANVPSLTKSSSSSATPTSPLSVLQEVGSPSLHPASCVICQNG